MNTPSNTQNGITLIEILVALALSLIILAGVMHIFLNNKQTYRVQEAFARMQENGRFAMQLLAKDLRMAGYVGCGGKISEVNNLVDLEIPKGNDPSDADDISMFNSSGLEGFEYSNLPIQLNPSTSLTTANVYAGTDIIRIKRAASTGARLWGNMTSDTAKVQLDGATALGLFKEKDILFISDCEKADIFVANNVSEATHPITIAHPDSDNVGSKLSKVYQKDAELYKFIINTYYIGTNAAGEPALIRRAVLNGATLSNEELVEGIEDLQVLYGEDTDNDGTPNMYRESLNVADWDNVVAVRIELQVRSLEDNLARKEDDDYKDRRLRRTFTTSIAIRNRTI